MNKSFCSIFIILLFFISDSVAQCNGFDHLCNKRYNEVAYLTTHNAFNCEAGGFLIPNQHNTITQQLNDGVRAFMIDVYDVNGVPTVYHGYPYLGTVPFLENLIEIKGFLDNNPKEIVSIILECYITSDEVENSLNRAGIFSYLYAKDSTILWPTLQELIDSDKRLVVFSERDNGMQSQNWYHFIWDYAVETNFEIHDASEFTCNYNRGNSLNDLFIFNHFITNDYVGTGEPDQASIANSYTFFINRINECFAAKNKFPNFLAVDFYDLGDCIAVLNTVNSPNWSINFEYPKQENISISPNPASDIITISGIESVKQVDIYDITAKLLKTGTNTSINISDLKQGMYLISIIDDKGFVKTKKIIKE